MRYAWLDQERVQLLWFGPAVRGEQSVGNGLRCWEGCKWYAVSKTNDANHFIQWSGVAQRSVMKERLETCIENRKLVP